MFSNHNIALPISGEVYSSIGVFHEVEVAADLLASLLLKFSNFFNQFLDFGSVMFYSQVNHLSK